MRKFLLIFLTILICSSTVFGLTHTSPSYTLKDARIIPSSGKTSSINYSLNDARIGSVFGGKALSLNYSLDATNLAKKFIPQPPNPPTVNPVTTPTNISTQTLSGTKDADTSIYINGYLAVPQDNHTAWSYEVSLEEGENYFIITSRNQHGLESESVTVAITLDTIAPEVIITLPSDGAVVTTATITLEGTIDGVPFSEERTLSEGTNTIAKEAQDEVGNTGSASITVTLDTTPPAAPTVNPVTTPTNRNTQTLSGTKEANTSIWINGVERASLDSLTSWSTEVSLNEGNNTFNITAKDAALNESFPAAVDIFLDTSNPTTPVVIDDGAYTTSTSQLHASWTSEDLQTGIVKYIYVIGTTIDGMDVVGWTSTGTQAEVTHTGLSLIQGQTYYFSVIAENGAGAWSETGSSDGIKVNQNIPAIIAVQPPNESTGYVKDDIKVTVSAQDPDGDTLQYQFSVDGEIIQPWQSSNEFNWSASGISSGLHSVRTEVSDNNGGIAFEDITLYLFRDPPPLP